MTGKSQPTPGTWRYQSHRSRQIVSDTGETVAKVHRGKKAQHNGPILAAGMDTAFATAMLLDAVEKLRRGDAVPDIDQRVADAEAALSRAKGEAE